MIRPAPSVTAVPNSIDRSRAHTQAVAWARRIVSRGDAVYLDTETTGIDGRAEIVEIAVVDHGGATLLDTLIRPDDIIPAEVTRIHGIDDTMVADAPRWPDVYPLLAEIIHGRTVVVYNAEFDFRLVNQMNRRSGYPLRADAWDCAMKQYAGYASEWHARYGNYRWHKLGVALTHFGHSASGHRACADAAACRLVVCGMADGGSLKT